MRLAQEFRALTDTGATSATAPARLGSPPPARFVLRTRRTLLKI